jgi:MarR family transcriptional regulator, organic hydroperoxide resistance regulator
VRSDDAEPTAVPSLAGRYFSDHFFASLLTQAVNLMNQRFKLAIKDHSLSLSQWRTLAALTNADDLSLTEIMDLTSIGQTTLSRVIDGLERKGLVSAAPRSDDARYVAISLTPAGRDVVAQVWPVAWRHSQEALHAALTEEEAEQLRTMLQRVVLRLRER